MNKPSHLSSEYAEQFQDESVVKNYKYRPAYSEKVIRILDELAGKQNRSILDVGCGSGEISIPMAELGYSVDAIDPSIEMIETGRGKSTEVNWYHSNAEGFDYKNNSYDLICGANSLHWPDWPIVFPMLRKALKKDRYLAIITGGELQVFDIQNEITKLVIQYSTNKDFKPFSLIDLLEEGNHFKTAGSCTTDAEIYSQKPEEFIASFHARNGFSYERMGKEAAQEFDDALLELISPQLKSGLIEGTVQSTVTWGYPL